MHLHLAVIGILAAAGALVQAADHVVVLDKDNFKSVVADDKLVMVKFYAPWCGHCKALAPEYEKAAEELKETEITLAKIDCTEERDLCSEHDVQGYPTIKIFNGGKASDYSGARKADAIVAHLKKKTLPVLSEVKAEDLEKFKTSDKVVVVGFYDDSVEDHKDEHETLLKVAKDLSEEAVFGYTEGVKSAEENGVKQPALVLFKKFDEGKVIYDGKFEAEEIAKFIAANKVPLIDEIGPENFMSYVDAGLPLAYLFVDDDDTRQPLIDALKPIAKDYKGKVNFVWIDATKYAGHASNLNLDESWPAFAIQEPKEQTKFPMSQKDKVKAEGIREFVEKFVKGEIKPSIKSEPIPEKNDEPVKVIVADEFDKIVMNKDKDVLVEFYAPWCGHCKKLVPIYDELGKKFEAHQDKIVIAKMDATANDIPPSAGFTVSGFPTLKLVKAGTNEVVEYEGDRSLESLTKFMLENTTNKVELKEEEKKTEEKKEEEEEKKEEKDEHDEL